MSRLCFKDSFISLTCGSCKEKKIIPVRCNLSDLRNYQCGFCSRKRRSIIIAKALNRYDKVKNKSDKLVLWTFGTSLHDSQENRELIVQMWKLFIRRMQYYIKKTNAKFDPLMNCLEAGSRGNRLHYHVVARGYMYHNILLNIWRNITQEKSNVNFSASYSNRSAPRAFGYLAKYASKGYAYYWMGSLHQAKIEDGFYDDQDCQHEWEMNNIYSYGYRLQFQVKLQKYEIMME